jgi:hypothetical protein
VIARWLPPAGMLWADLYQDPVRGATTTGGFATVTFHDRP